MYKHVEYFDKYGRIMQFNKNKSEPIHRWYPFVEGYSKEFIQSIVKEIDKKDVVCLEPFSGSGTTPLELQNENIMCYSFEVNPLMYLVSKTKLETDYDCKRVESIYKGIVERRVDEEVYLSKEFPTLYEGNGRKKWNLDKDSGIAIEKLRQSISKIQEDKYRELFTVTLASVLLDASNLYRNGKCLSYKTDWKKKKISEKEVFDIFDKKVINDIVPDIRNPRTSEVNNKELLFREDSRVGIENRIKNDTVDLVITSPPYLNSRDYTDTYMLELKALGLTDSYEKITELRQKTIRSHVQIKWEDDSIVDDELLEETLDKLNGASNGCEKWNSSIIDMVRLYFCDMKKIFESIFSKMKSDGRVYFNVSNSAYFNILINTLDICASIAEKQGFEVIAIRDARKLKPSPQQKESIDSLLEGVIVMRKP